MSSSSQHGSAEGYDESDMVTIAVSHRGTVHEFKFDNDAVVSDLFSDVAQILGVPLQNQKIFVPKKPLLTWPPKNPDQPLGDLVGKKLMLMGAMADETLAVQDMSEKLKKRNAAQASAAKHARKERNKKAKSSNVDPQYTFADVRPLNFLPNPRRSLDMLLRLKEDPGIVHSMRKNKLSVSLLTEMEPLMHTESSHEGTSRTLGLNRNNGEVIELRLRTDAHDGYRDYKVIRKTLCHELAHNKFSDHDRNFWDFCHQIEREVDQNDWKSSGHTLNETSRYHVSGRDSDVDDHADSGSWTGGSYVLGGVRTDTEGMSRQEILARAAMERNRQCDQAECAAEKGWRPCQRPKKPSDDEKE